MEDEDDISRRRRSSSVTDISKLNDQRRSRDGNEQQLTLAISLNHQTAIDDSLHLYQNTSSGETPFVNKIVDPFGESPSQLLLQTPVGNFVKKNLFGSLNHDKKNPNEIFNRIRLRHQQAHMMDYETQSQIDAVIIDDNDDEDGDATIENSFKMIHKRILPDDDDTQKIQDGGDETEVIDTHLQETQQILDTQLITSDQQTLSTNQYEIPATQVIRRSIEVPSTVEKIRQKNRSDVFDEITSQQTTSSGEEEGKVIQDIGESLDFSKSNKLEIGSDEEIENTTVMYDMIELNNDEKQDQEEYDEGEEEEEDDDSAGFRAAFAEDSLGVYDQLRLKRRQFSEIELKKKPRLSRTRTDFDTPSKTSSWFEKKRQQHGLKSSPSTEIPNSSPSMVQLKVAKNYEYSAQLSSPTTQVINTAPDDTTTQQIGFAQDPMTFEVVSSKHSSDVDDNGDTLMEELQPPPETLVNQHQHQQQNKENESIDDSPLTDLEDDVYREVNDGLTQNDILHYSSVWARTGDKFHPTVIKKVLSDGFVIIHEGKQVNLQGFLNVFPLDIKIGDLVKIYNRRKIHCVCGLSSEMDDSETRIQCIRGFDTVHVMPCIRNEIDLENGVEEKIPLSHIYLVNSIWTKRDFIKELDSVEYQDSLVLKLPKIRGRHSKELLKLSPHKNAPPIIIPNLIMPSPLPSASSLSRVGTGTGTDGGNSYSGVFRRCCFSITSSSSTEAQKDIIKKLILENGGKILEIGLIELFDDHHDQFEISAFYGNYKLGLVISLNGYSRSAKYLESLLLGWPILSDRFIIDASNNSSVLNKFESYLLPAGESNLLGTVKSLNIYKFMKNYYEGKLLSSQIGNNFFLQGYQVLRIASSNTTNNNKDKNSIMQFLFKCLGVVEITAYDTISRLCMEYSLLDSNVKDRTLIFIDHAQFPQIRQELINVGTLVAKITDWEWVVQSVISGMMLEFKEF